jgi:hypothetical protein
MDNKLNTIDISISKIDKIELKINEFFAKHKAEQYNILNTVHEIIQKIKIEEKEIK